MAGAPADRTRGCPAWPSTDIQSYRHVMSALLSGRLAVSGAKSRWPSRGALAAACLAQALGRRHAVLTTNGSSAIVVALHALGIGPGDVVLMPATTWVSCATAVFRVGAEPRYFDATADSPCGPVPDLAAPPAAILAIHLYAQYFDVAAARARFPGVPIIEDASHNHQGVTRAGDRIGTLGDLTIISLQATKVLTCGEGGAVLTDDDAMAGRLESLVMDSRRRAHIVSPTASTELEPALLLHGANHALPELSAALLLDQIERLPAQLATRSHGAQTLVNELSGSSWTTAADQHAIHSGGFYGLVLRIPDGAGSPQRVIEQVERRLGLVLDQVYPPVPEGPLYRPGTIAQYAAFANTEHGDFPQSRYWHENTVVVPHHVFLGDESTLHALAGTLRPMPAAQHQVHHGPSAGSRRTVDVVIVTRGTDQEGLDGALASVARQDTSAAVTVTIWVDGGDLPVLDTTFGLNTRTIRVTDASLLPTTPFERLATLRKLAVQLCEGDYVAFLDDDNEWETDHLESLLRHVEQGFPAAHSWRRLLDRDGTPTKVDRFPWLAPGPAATERFEELIRGGIMARDSAVVRDRVTWDRGSHRPAMVDIGEWLFDRSLLQTLEQRLTRTPGEVAARVGEDDRLLEQLIALGVPVACTERPTLRYRLGGMSTPEYATTPAHSRTIPTG
ncbi:aminotransferase class I/II-fold pyridoxal phosphate-dependent enzyme [Actinocrispum wychmicini]|uniref:dTDP-4-amino-4,6-dideoxygalactose transaminase n=1 Tax=Actinocrispum wychmicini TaxID=1213861 RepID=A0A4R2K482_9PSEU|nr:aminotransferase class I/II-fold pyridoxal phosphate-dependent enzyme [Actinocrispum wychmicini]TCO61145.1 dTDP-4-amino-4,6-dideoxygalactose transaminase [Actinocrispum wychmicini]